MSTTAAMINSHPNRDTRLDPQKLAAAIDATTACAQTCTACAQACLAEDSVAELRDCIRTDLVCADICTATASVLTRHIGAGNDSLDVLKVQLSACIIACGTCAQDCESHAEHHEHCRICAQACRECEKACSDLLDSLS